MGVPKRMNNFQNGSSQNKVLAPHSTFFIIRTVSRVPQTDRSELVRDFQNFVCPGDLVGFRFLFLPVRGPIGFGPWIPDHSGQ